MSERRRNHVLDDRWKRTWRWALFASIGVHVLLLLLLWVTPPLPVIPVSAAGPRAGDPSAAAGGGDQLIAFQTVSDLPETEPVEEVVEPEPVPVPDPTVAPVEPPREARPTAPSSGQTAQPNPGEGRGEAKGPGTETGTGAGDGGTGEEGLYKLTAPSPRGLILPPSDRPGSVRGKSVTVYVFVTERGRVVSDSTRLAPSSGDSRFDRRLKEQASEWQFRPGMRGAQPIPAWFQYTIIL